MLTSGWKTATVADEEKLSGEVDLGNHYNRVLIIVPTLDTDATCKVQVSNVSGGTFRDLWNLYIGTPADVAIPEEGATVVDIAGARYLKISCTTNQTGGAIIYIIGVPW